MKRSTISLLTQTLLLLWIASGFVISVQAQEQTLHFKGSTALGKFIKPFHEEIQKAAGVKFELSPTGNGRGLLDLEEHRSDAAMLGGPLLASINTLNETNKTKITGKNFVEHVVYKIPMKFMVPEGNPVKSITLEQGHKILTGEIRNWKELGGPDLKIVVVATIPTGGARITYTAEFLQGKPLSLTTRIIRNGEALVEEVGKIPGGITLTDVSTKGLPLKALKTDAPLYQSFAIVTLGEATPRLKAIIEQVQLKLNQKGA